MQHHIAYFNRILVTNIHILNAKKSSDMERRQFVVGIGTLSTGVIAGCLTQFEESDDEVNLCRVSVHNRHSESVAVELQIVEDDSVLFDKFEEIPAPEEGEVDGVEATILDGFTLSKEELPSEPGRYTVRMRLEDAGWEQLHTYEQGVDNISVMGEVNTRTEEASPPASLTLLTSTDPDYC